MDTAEFRVRSRRWAAAYRRDEERKGPGTTSSLLLEIMASAIEAEYWDMVADVFQKQGEKLASLARGTK